MGRLCVAPEAHFKRRVVYRSEAQKHMLHLRRWLSINCDDWCDVVRLTFTKYYVYELIICYAFDKVFMIICILIKFILFLNDINKRFLEK